MTLLPQDSAERAPDLIAPVIGYRQWRLDGDTLRSPFRDDAWAAATFRARCATGAHPGQAAPVGACSCGTHAWYAQCPRLASAATALVAGAVVMPVYPGAPKSNAKRWFGRRSWSRSEP